MDILTDQENRIAHCISQGLVEKEIAEKLFISKHTVHTHYRNIRVKTGARNIADITRIYILSLLKATDVLKTISVCFFLSLQIHIVFYDADMDLRRVKIGRVGKVLRAKKGKRKNEYNL